MKNKPVIIFILIVILAIFLKLFLFDDKIDMGEQAEKISKIIVSKHLISPGSAQFVNIEVGAPDGSLFIVFGDVDSQNSFGALLRSHFFHTFKYIGKNEKEADVLENWKTDWLEIGDYLYVSGGEEKTVPFMMTETMRKITAKQENMIKEVNKLKILRDNGSVTEEEFQKRLDPLLRVQVN